MINDEKQEELKVKIEKTGGNEMNTATPAVSLAAFIKANEELIFKITPKNPFLNKDDEWRDKEYEVSPKDDN